MVWEYHYQRQRAGRTTEDVVAPLPTLLHPRHHSTAGRVTSHIGEKTRARVRPLMMWPFGRLFPHQDVLISGRRTGDLSEAVLPAARLATLHIAEPKACHRVAWWCRMDLHLDRPCLRQDPNPHDRLLANADSDTEAKDVCVRDVRHVVVGVNGLAGAEQAREEGLGDTTRCCFRHRVIWTPSSTSPLTSRNMRGCAMTGAP